MKGKIDFRPVLIDLLKSYNRQRFLADLSAGIIVGIVALPLSIAFGIASGVSPERGLVTAVVGGFFVSLLGGSRVQIAGPTGAFIVVLYGIVQQFGLDGLLIATFMAGIIMLLLGIFKIGSLIQFMPYPIIVGFTSGIALIIFLSQIKDFFGLAGGDVPADFPGKIEFYILYADTINVYAMGTGLFTIIASLVSSRFSSRIPGSLFAIIFSAFIVWIFQLPVTTIGSKFGELSSGLPTPSIPTVDFNTFSVLLLPAFSIAMLGSIESLLSAMVADGATGHKHRPNTELIANGVANMALPILGGIPACGAVARTMTNVRNGGVTPISGIIHAVFVLLVLLFLGKWTSYIPMPALAGILFLVAYNMSEWRSFKGMFRNSKSDVSVLLTTFLLTVLIDISVAIQMGLVLAAFLFVKRISESSGIEVLTSELENGNSDNDDPLDIPEGVEVFQIKGPFFFGVANKFEESETQLGSRPQVRIIRMRHVPFIDSTGLKNLENFLIKTLKRDIHILISGLQPDTYTSLQKYGLIQKIGQKNVFENIEAALYEARKIIQKTSSHKNPQV